ncbi:RNA-binding protein 41-like [Amyelois transitella]|uniref:RNA-binding protein 41-like n=1 Tax=Amyelois transitella TaxID=680683 RepID=UPI00067B11E9|nr:RNA-binding protein 41-like [Amyelois transitella]
MSSQTMPKEFERSTEVLPIMTYGISTIEDLRRAEAEIRMLDKLKKAGLSSEEVKLYRDNENGVEKPKVEASALKRKLESIYEKISDYDKTVSQESKDNPSTSSPPSVDVFERLRDKPITIYPDPNHPMNNLKEIEQNLFGHLDGDVTPLSKRRKELRRFERSKEKILNQDGHIEIPTAPVPTVNREGSLWDVKELPKPKNVDIPIIGPSEKKPVMYSIRNNKIVRLEALPGDCGCVHEEEYQAVEIVAPVNNAERELLEGTQMSLDDIRKIDRFKDYEPGIPSKVLYLKNLASSVTREQLALLFNQFMMSNGGPINVDLLTGRMRGQAFVSFTSEDIAIQALEEVNGTIMCGRPIIAEFGRNNNTNREDAYETEEEDEGEEESGEEEEYT